MKSKRLCAVAAAAVLTACSSGPSAEQRAQLNTLIGKTEVDVIRAYGVPTRTFQASGHTFLAYIDNQTSYSPGTGSAWGWGWGGSPGWGGGGWGWGGGMGGWGNGWGGGWGGGGGMPPSYYNSSCQTTFELANGVVSGWTMRGDGC
ncbi:hypothetical protein J2D73_07625 [Acetobacter sacchari]|uniref:Uncharacterized protein n=1 Tax=Acetobacter sacchari TaxID=2661687 RepID=A0ABS3LUS5_9PROT|nr:hypothetical protein [Acetobacter sacchari]MBO1359662.1 hypothetical protein [Acetobacter sacchari]